MSEIKAAGEESRGDAVLKRFSEKYGTDSAKNKLLSVRRQANQSIGFVNDFFRNLCTLSLTIRPAFRESPGRLFSSLGDSRAIRRHFIQFLDREAEALRAFTKRVSENLALSARW